MAGVRAGVGDDGPGMDTGIGGGKWCCKGRKSGLNQGELGERAGGLDYAAVSVTVKPFERRLARDAKLRGIGNEIQKHIVEC
jgi:hypothetical protein